MIVLLHAAAARPTMCRTLNACRAARIAARCKRIQEKLAAVRQQGDASTGVHDVTAAQEMTRTQQQLLASARRLVKLKHDTQQAVTAARVASGELESTRRTDDERVRQVSTATWWRGPLWRSCRPCWASLACAPQYHHQLAACLPACLQDLRSRLLTETEAAAAASAAIAKQWARVPGMSVPQDMMAAIEQQRLACEAVVAGKDQLIAGTPACLLACLLGDMPVLRCAPL